MKKLLMAAVAVSALAASPAMAADFAVTGTVAPACGALTDKPIGFSTITTNSDGTLPGTQDASSAPQDVYCNDVNATITVASTQVLTAAAGTPADNSSFQRTITYTADVLFAGTNFPVGATQTLGAKAGTMVVSANNLSATLRPYAAAYDGLITVTLAPGA